MFVCVGVHRFFSYCLVRLLHPHHTHTHTHITITCLTRQSCSTSFLPSSNNPPPQGCVCVSVCVHTLNQLHVWFVQNTTKRHWKNQRQAIQLTVKHREACRCAGVCVTQRQAWLSSAETTNQLNVPSGLNQIKPKCKCKWSELYEEKT